MTLTRWISTTAVAALGGFLWSTVHLVAHPQTSAGLPGRLGEYVTQNVKLSPDEHARLLAGEPVTKLLPTDASKEMAVFGAVWINAPSSAYVAAVKDIEQFEKGANFLVTKEISSPPRLEDFDRLTLPPEDVADLRTCKVGACELKLGADALERVRKEVDWTKPLPQATTQLETLIRKMALEYVIRYQQGGNAALAEYRDSARPTFVAEEFKTMIEQMPSLTTYLPQLKTYLLEYPRATLPKADGSGAQGREG